MRTLLAGLAVLALSCAAGELPAPAGELKIIGSGFRFTEGPAADAAGNLYFTDIPAERIYRLSAAGELTIFRENSGGANGLYFTADGGLAACEGGRGRLTLTAPGGTVTVLTDSYAGRPFNRPNDLWIDPQGGIYFSDPIYGKTEKKQDGEHVYYLTPDRSETIRVIDDFIRPNGLIGTPDGRTLYVADHGAGKIWRYAIEPGGTLSGKTLFAEAACDGMTLDAAGNLYATENVVLIFNPDGVQIAEIATPEKPTNVTFGGTDRRTLFITARSVLCAVLMHGIGLNAPADLSHPSNDAP